MGRKVSQEGSNIPSLEQIEIPRRKIKFISISAGKIPRHFSIQSILSVLKMPLGFIQSFIQVKKLKPNVVLSFGGYIAIPVSLSAWILKIPIVTHEQTTSIGLSNKLIELFASKIAISWNQSRDQFKKKVILTGNPVREALVKGREKALPVNLERELIYVTGGNQGSHFINNLISKSLSEITSRYIVVHQCGTGIAGKDFEKLSRQKHKLDKILQPRYLIKKWFDDQQVAWLMHNASLIISRSGANTIYEIALHAIPSILIPLPKSGGNEQTLNAQVLKQAGTAEILFQSKLTKQLFIEAIKKMFDNLDTYKLTAEKFKNDLPKDGAQKLIKLVRKAYEEKTKKELKFE